MSGSPREMAGGKVAPGLCEQAAPGRAPSRPVPGEGVPVGRADGPTDEQGAQPFPSRRLPLPAAATGGRPPPPCAATGGRQPFSSEDFPPSAAGPSVCGTRSAPPPPSRHPRRSPGTSERVRPLRPAASEVVEGWLLCLSFLFSLPSSLCFF